VGLVLMCLSDRDDYVERRLIESGTNKKCPFCAEIIKTEASVCRFCGRDIFSSNSTVNSNRSFVAQQSALIAGKVYKISKDGQDFGELSKDEIVDLLRSNDLTPEDRYYDVRSRSWLPLKNNSIFAI
jgi:RNA polymerase subunit RPABC4/transcription elongation factor Spt4